MSYQVLARKWRPRTFREMVGQEHVLKALINALDRNRLHHAYLFTGTRGVGKTTIARILAKCLNCETGISSEPCGRCSACTEIGGGRFVDLIEVDAASRTRVEDTRELMDNVQYAPTRGRFKIYLIDEVHMLSNHSFNALLKTLEEPPLHVKFLLATTDPQKLPVTILSRCLQFNLKNMSPERIVQHLGHVLTEEKVPHESSALWLLARAADGSMRDALSLTDQAIGFGDGKVGDDDVSSMLGTIDHRLIERLIRALIATDGAALLRAVAEVAEHAPDYVAALEDLATLLHRLAIAQTVPEALDNSYGDREQVLALASQLTAEDVQLFYQMALLGRRDLALAPDVRAGFEMVLLRMLAFKPQGVVDVPDRPLVAPASDQPAPPPVDAHAAVPEVASEEKKPIAEVANQRPLLAELAHRVTAVDGPALTPAPLPPAGVRTPEPPAAAGPKPARIGLATLQPADWLALSEALEVRGVLQSTVNNSVLSACEGHHLHFVLDPRKSSLYDDSHEKRLADLLSDYFGEPVKASVARANLPEGATTPAMQHEINRQQRQREALEALQRDPVVQSLEQEFGIKLDPSRVELVKAEAKR